MDTEWIDARIDGSDLRVGDAARLVWGYTEACHGIVTDFKTNGVCMEPGVSRKPVMYGRDRTGDEWRWQYHAPTRAKLEAADRERVTVTSITSDTMTVQPAAARDATAQVPVARSVECLSCGTWRTSSFPVCACGETRWLAERSGFRGGIQTPPDPFAAVRAEAKRMLENGADPRVVLGALDECVRREDPLMWKLQLAYYTVEATKDIARHIARASSGHCYHGNRAGTCGWCALSRDRSDARAVASHEPAWETADCEGE